MEIRRSISTAGNIWRLVIGYSRAIFCRVHSTWQKLIGSNHGGRNKSPLGVDTENAGDGGADSGFKKLTVRDLLTFYETFKNDEHVRGRKDIVTFIVCLHVVKVYLGDGWIVRNLNPGVSRHGFMRLLVDASPEAEKQAARVWDLGELLFNLAAVEGYPQFAERMKTEEPESCVAELHVARQLYVNDVSFRFVKPSGTEDGDNFDLEITYPDGTVVCGETKCKIESTQLSKKTIALALNKARRQLPDDRPGIIFIKFPQTWFEGGQQQQAERTMVLTAAEFFSGAASNTRVISVIYYCEALSWNEKIVHQGHLFKEVPNLNNKFSQNRDWSLLHYKPLSGDHWNKLPEKWVRLVKFPDELGKHGKI